MTSSTPISAPVLLDPAGSGHDEDRADQVSEEQDGSEDLSTHNDDLDPDSCYDRETGSESSTSKSIADDLLEESMVTFRKEFPEADLDPALDLDVAALDWSNFPAQLFHRRQLPEREKSLLGVLYRKCHYIRKNGQPGYWNNQCSWREYDSLSAILVRANFAKKESFVMCGWPRKDGLASYCRQVRFCPRCNHVFRRQPILDEYGDAFSKEQEVWFLTLSLTRETDEKRRFVYKDLEERDWEQITERGATDGCLHTKPALPFDSGADYLQCAKYLKIMQRVMKEFSDAKRFRGAVGAAEVATWFQPLSVIPHMHYVVFASSFSEDDARDLRRRLKDLIRNSRGVADKMQPSVACYRLPASADLRRVLAYCFKPIALNVAYKVALCRGEYSVRRLDALNEELDMFLEGFEVVFTEVLTVHRLGICNPCADEYCGVVTGGEAGEA